LSRFRLSRNSGKSGSQHRIIDDDLDEYVADARGAVVAVALEGARAVGKTSTAGRRAVSRFELDNEAHHAVVTADVGLALSQPPPVLIDEWQHYPRPARDATVRTPPGDVTHSANATRRTR
jgi:hypothetical protein